MGVEPIFLLNPFFPTGSKEFIEKEPGYSRKLPQTNLNL